MLGYAYLSQARSTAFFVGVRVSGVGAKTRTPSEPACFGGAIGFACSSGLLWLAVHLGKVCVLRGCCRLAAGRVRFRTAWDRELA